MALRDYMQDLLRAQTSSIESNHGNDHHEESGVFKITIVDDNSSSALPNDQYDEGIDDSLHRSFSNGTTRRNGIRQIRNDHCRHRHHHDDMPHHHDYAGEETTNDEHRTMLEGFRRRHKFLRETLSPGRASPHQGNLLSPSATIVTQWTPTVTSIDSDGDSSEVLPRDSQRGRMRRLKEERDASPPLLV